MKANSFFAYSLAGVSLLVSYAHSVDISNVPPHSTAATSHNLLLVVDDSGSMDYELMLTSDTTYDSVLWWNEGRQSFLRDDGNLVDQIGGSRQGKYKYTTLFPNGDNGYVGGNKNDRVYDGRRIDADNRALPPVKAYAFARSPQYNGTYYDPTVTYEPWPSVGGYAFGDSSPTGAKYDPMFPRSINLTVAANVQSDEIEVIEHPIATNPVNGRTSKVTVTTNYTTGDITTFTESYNPDTGRRSTDKDTVNDPDIIRTRPTLDDGYEFYAHKGMVCSDAGARCRNDGHRSFDYYLPTVYLQQYSGTVTYRHGSQSKTYSCNPNETNKADADVYLDFSYHPDRYSFSGTDVVAIAPDGGCLRKYEIKASNTMPPKDDANTTRTYAEEIQNFANWFTYGRRRHQVSRGAIAQSIESLSAFNAAQYWFNDIPDDVTLNNISIEANKRALLKANYEHVISRGGTVTKIREALEHAGEVYDSGVNSPITSSCQQNFTLLFTDGYSTVKGSNVDSPSLTTDNDSDGTSSTLGDIAYKYYNKDLGSHLTDDDTYKVPIPTECKATVDNPNPNPSPAIDCNPEPHMTTFTIGLGALGQMFGRTHNSVDDAWSLNSVTNVWSKSSNTVWPTSTALAEKTPDHIDDLYHAAVNGKGQAYSAQNATGLTLALSDAISKIASGTGGGNRVSYANSGQNDNTLFSASYIAGTWSGEISAHEVIDGRQTNNSKWSASTDLNVRDYETERREIMTYNRTTGKGVPFLANNIDDDMKVDLSTEPDGTTNDDHIARRIKYFYGDTSDEGSLLRNRESILGDIINSAPIFAGAPQLNYPDSSLFGSTTNTYASFKTAQKDRQGVVYVGANDGMLHAFDAATGEEIFAYIPSFLSSSEANEGLHYLTDPDYVHRYYVDGVPKMSDVYISHNNDAGTLVGDAWRTVLAGSVGFGGKGVFLLDITDPATFRQAKAASIVEWEFSSADNANMGMLNGAPKIAMMNNGKWSMIFGNGYNSATGNTGLFILDIEAGMDGDWGITDYKFIQLSANDGVSSGLSDITVVDLDGNGTADRVFGGDLKGRMWAIDVSDVSSVKWKTAYGTAIDPVPFFTGSTTQPISAAPTVARHPTAFGDDKNLLVSFGTGQYLSLGDSQNDDTQSFYTLWDDGSAIAGTDDLQQLLVTTNTSADTRNVRSTTIDWATKSGWYINLPETRERVVGKAYLRAGILRFVTITPVSDACLSGGSSWVMAIPLDGVVDNSNYFNTNDDGIVDTNDDVIQGQRFDSKLLNQLEAGIGDSLMAEAMNSEDEVNLPIEELAGEFPQGRLSWRQLVNEN